ncbi:MAG: cell cycle transcriptional regulator TrcR [Alphaproteobacteria bacterium]
MRKPLMPKATAVWLVENTGLSFKQIADFTGLHALEIKAIADDEVASSMQGLNPVLQGELTKEEITKGEADHSHVLEAAPHSEDFEKITKQKTKYTPVARRADKPNAIAWLIKVYPELSDSQISRLIGTTRPTINAVRDKTHWNSENITPKNPVLLDLCKESELEKAVVVAQKRQHDGKSQA